MQRIERALLVVPPTGLYIRGEDRCQVPVQDLTATSARMPLDLGLIASNLKEAGVECRVRDYPIEGGDWKSFETDLADFTPQLLVISSVSFTLQEDTRAARMAKSLLGEVVTLVKGAESAMSDLWLMEQHPELDGVLKGEYELSLAPFVRGEEPAGLGITFRRDGRVIPASAVPLIEDLNELPVPARELLRNELYVRPDTGRPQTTIQTGRGCPSKCTYCLAPVLHGGRLRQRDPERVANEVSECTERFGIRNFFFRADTFTYRRKWTLETARLMEERAPGIEIAFNSRVDTFDAERAEALRRAGGWLVAFGIESGSEKSLELMKKGASLNQAREAVRVAKEHGFRTYLFFMLGFPWESREDIERTTDFAQELDGDFAEFHIAVPFKGTPFYDQAHEGGVVLQEDLSGYGHNRAVVRTATLSGEELEKLRSNALWRYYSRPSYIARTLWKARSPRSVANYIRYGLERVITHRR